MKPEDADALLQRMVAEGKLAMGLNVLLDHRDGTVHEVMVWATGGVWYTHHFDKDHPNYRKKKMAALRGHYTLHIPRDHRAGPVKTL